MNASLAPQSKVPRHYKERSKSAGQPMRSQTLTSRCLPLIYINTNVIRVFCPGTQDKHMAVGERERTHKGAVCLTHLVPACKYNYVCLSGEAPMKKEDTLVLKLGSVSMAPQADNPLSRTVLRKDIYQ